MQEIRAEPKTIRQLLGGAKYSIEYYQREYKWQTKQVTELLDDLSLKFRAEYEEQHERHQVAGYGHYFLGSIIISQKLGTRFIIDGQQRLTSLTLLLIYLNNLQRGREERVHIDELIFSERFGKRSFNLDVDDRSACMDALYTGQPLDETGNDESVRNIIDRYRDIEANFPEDLKEQALPFFIDWLIESVYLVEITAYADEDAYTIFETMNDRGLSLTPTDMLKGYLLANITDEQDRVRASQAWKRRVLALAELGKDEDADAVKAWPRSQHAETIRERKQGASPGDFDLIGTEFHRWVKERAGDLDLIRGHDFVRFIEDDFAFYTGHYIQVIGFGQKLTAEFEPVFYNARLAFTLQYPVLMAPIRFGDDNQTVMTKVRLVATFLDILIARRLWNWRDISYSTMQYAMFLLMKEIRGLGIQDLLDVLQRRLDADTESFTSNPAFNLHQMNGPAVKLLLARMTDYVERESGESSRFTEYIGGKGAERYEIEHIWADHFERHTDEFPHPTEFDSYRSRIGGLLLLPKRFNASYGDKTYEDKLDHYSRQNGNFLARSLSSSCYAANPGFLGFVRRSGLPFREHPQFRKEDLDARQELYTRLAETVWSPDRLRTIVDR